MFLLLGLSFPAQVMTIDISEGRSEQLHLRAGDSATAIAEEFCRKHGLDTRVVQPLATHIQTNLQKVVKNPDRSVRLLPVCRVSMTCHVHKPEMNLFNITLLHAGTGAAHLLYFTFHQQTRDALRQVSGLVLVEGISFPPSRDMALAGEKSLPPSRGWLSLRTCFT
eukprot:5342247-Pyramimonas_sp.AAC.1